MVFQQYNLFPHLSAGQNVMLAQSVVKKSHRQQARAIAELMLERVGLGDKFDAFRNTCRAASSSASRSRVRSR